MVKIIYPCFIAAIYRILDVIIENDFVWACLAKKISLILKQCMLVLMTAMLKLKWLVWLGNASFNKTASIIWNNKFGGKKLSDFYDQTLVPLQGGEKAKVASFPYHIYLYHFEKYKYQYNNKFLIGYNFIIVKFKELIHASNNK